MTYPQRYTDSTTTTIFYKSSKEQPKPKSRGKPGQGLFIRKPKTLSRLEPGDWPGRHVSSEIGASRSRNLHGATSWIRSFMGTRPMASTGGASFVHRMFCTPVDSCGCPHGVRLPEDQVLEKAFVHSKKFNPCASSPGHAGIGIRSRKPSTAKGNHGK